MYEGLKSQYDKLESDRERLQQELTNKDTALKAEQLSHQQLKDKYDTLLKTIDRSKIEKREDIIQE